MGGPGLSAGKETAGSEHPPFFLGGTSTLHGGDSNKGGETGQDTAANHGAGLTSHSFLTPGLVVWSGGGSWY